MLLLPLRRPALPDPSVATLHGVRLAAMVLVLTTTLSRQVRGAGSAVVAGSVAALAVPSRVYAVKGTAAEHARGGQLLVRVDYLQQLANVLKALVLLLALF